MAKMHADEVDIDAGLVHRLLLVQFPHWADLPIERLASGGTVNAIYRLGDELTVRLPLTAGGLLRRPAGHCRPAHPSRDRGPAPHRRAHRCRYGVGRLEGSTRRPALDSGPLRASGP